MAGTTDFLAGASGDPLESKRQLAEQSCLHIDDFNPLRDGRTNAGPITFDKRLVDALKLAPGGVPTPKLDGKAVINDFTINFGDVDPADRMLIHLLNNLLEFRKVTDNTTWRKWEFALSALTTPEAADRFLKLIVDTDVLPRMRVLDMLVGGMNLSAEAEGNFAVDFDCVASRFDFWGIPVQITGAASSLPTILGDYSLDDATDNDAWDGTFTDSLFIEITTISAGVVTIKAEFAPIGGGTPAPFGSSFVTYTLGDTNGVRLVLASDGSAIGLFSRPILFTALAGATFVATDVFEVPVRRADFVPTLPLSRSIAVVGTQVFKGTQQLSTEGGWELSAVWETTEVVLDPSQEQGGTPRRRGELVVTLTPTRQITNLDLQRALARKETLSWVIEGRTNVDIPSAGRPYLARFIIPAGRVMGPSYGTSTGGESTEESVVITAQVPASAFEFPVGSGETYASHFHAVLETDADEPI